MALQQDNKKSTVAMHPFVQRLASGLVLSTSLMLTACGGGDSQPTFDVGMLVAGQPVGGVHLQPGLQQTISVVAGQSFEFDSSDPVTWSVVFAGTDVQASGQSYYYDGLTLAEGNTTAYRFLAYTSGEIVSGIPVPIQLVIRSIEDPSQRAVVNLNIIN